jgi:competence protein ComEC
VLAIFVCTAALVGLAAGIVRPLDPLGLGLASVASLIGAILGWRARPARFLALAAFVCGAAALRPTLWPTPTADALSPLVGSRVVLEGRVSSAPRVTGQTATFQMAVVQVSPSTGSAQTPGISQAVDARVEVISQANGVARRLTLGDWISAEGKLVEPTSPAGFPRAELLRRQGVFSVHSFPRITLLERSAPEPALLAGSVRASVERGFARYLPQPQAALASGMLLGGGPELGSAFRQQLQVAGLGHLVAVSGFNVIVVAAALNAMAVRLVGRHFALLPVLLGIAAYTTLTGAPPSAVRAALMVGAAVVASAVGRVPDPLTAVLLAAAVMGMAEPLVLLDVGFQLSFAATLGLILIYPRIRRLLSRLPTWLAEPLALTVAAELATLPVVLTTFHQVSLVSPAANVLAAPLVPLIMAAGTLFVPALLIPPVASGLAWLVWLPTTVFVEMVQVVSSMPSASVFVGHVPTVTAVVLAALLLLWGVSGLPETAGARAWVQTTISGWRWRDRAALAGVVGVTLLAALVAVMRPDGYLHVNVLAAGQGHAFLVRGPNGATVLVPGTSPDPRGLASLVGNRLNAWERSIAGVLVMDQADQAAMAETLRRYPAASLWQATQDMRVDLGGGAAVDAYFDELGMQGVAVSFGEVWVQLAGLPPAPAESERVVALAGGRPRPQGDPSPFLTVGVEHFAQDAEYALPPPQEGALELVSDGFTIWPANPADLDVPTGQAEDPAPLSGRLPRFR